jgi:CheY-like chemotaxis protein
MASILIIDDNETFRVLLEEMLIADGHVVTKASDGLEGAQMFRDNPTDLIITDIMMPHSGLSTIQVLRKQFPDVKIIAMSGGGTHRLDYAKSIGASCSLAKPFTFEKLCAAISETLAGKAG